jgi:hypothetical protein
MWGYKVLVTKIKEGKDTSINKAVSKFITYQK